MYDPLGCHNSAGSLFVWAFSLMFLFSGRGYWQELIESIIWAHKVVVAAHVLVYAGHSTGIPVDTRGASILTPVALDSTSEYFREDLQQDVLLFIDNIFRVVLACCGSSLHSTLTACSSVPLPASSLAG